MERVIPVAEQEHCTRGWIELGIDLEVTKQDILKQSPASTEKCIVSTLFSNSQTRIIRTYLIAMQFHKYMDMGIWPFPIHGNQKTNQCHRANQTHEWQAILKIST